jgi:hypothetical protein
MSGKTDECWRDLAGAIVACAIREYRAELKKSVRERRLSAKAALLEHWFRGEWCATLCEPFGVDPTRIAPKVREQVLGESHGDAHD